MKSPLEIDKETVKKFKITDEVSPVQKLSFLQEQLQQLQGMQWRARIDVVHAHRLIESPNMTLSQKGHSNLANHYNEVEQFTGAITQLKQLIQELREEYPELQVEE